MLTCKTFWVVVATVVLGLFVQVGSAAANCIVPLSSAEDSDVMYIVRGADNVLRFTIQDVNGDGTFGFTASTLPGNPFASGTLDTDGNGFADTLGSSSGYSNLAPWATLPGAPAAASDPVCVSFARQGALAIEILVRGNDANIYRTAFKTTATATYASFHRSLAIFDNASLFPPDPRGGEDGFPGQHGHSPRPFVRLDAPSPGGGGSAPRSDVVISVAFRGIDRDVVGPGYKAAPDGKADGHFSLTLDTGGSARVVSVVRLDTTDAHGNPTGGVWDTVPQGSYAVLGVIRDGRRLNPRDEAISDPVRGVVHYDLYAADYGYFREGGHFRVTVAFTDGGSAVVADTTIAGSGSGGSIPAGGAGWSATAATLRGHNGQLYAYTCPANGTARRVWGSDVYTDNSSVCTAAVHDGLITLADGGRVTIDIGAGESSYVGSTRNGITTRDYGSWPGSFVIAG